MGILQSACDNKKNLKHSKSSISIDEEDLTITEETIKKMQEQVKEVRDIFKPHIEQPNIQDSDIWPIKVEVNQYNKLLGRGSFGKVYLVSINNEYFAMKQVKKKFVLQKQHIENLLYEWYIMQQYEHPFLVKMLFAYQDQCYINLVMEYVQGGELFYHLQQRKKFDQSTTVFFAAQIVLALEFLHSKVGVIYRDLKPENVLIAKDGYIKLTDLGLAKHNSSLCYSFCGTDEYLAPEMIEEKGHNYNIDLWTLGCIIFEMLYGIPPFHHDNKKQLFINIQAIDYQFPPKASEEAKDLISKLLQYEPQKRLQINDIKNHKFFEKINFDDIYQKKVKPPFKPLLTSITDTRNFSYAYESQMKQSGIFNKEENDIFADFPYLPKNDLI